MQDETAARLGGRFTFEEDSIQHHLKIYYVDEDKPYSPKEGNYAILTPTSSWAHDMGTDSFKRHQRGGIDGIIVHKDVWDKIRLAEEIENYDHATDRWISNLDSIDPQPADEKAAEPIEVTDQETPKEKKETVKKMSDESTIGMVGKAALDGVKLVGASQANEAISKFAIKGIQATGVVPDEFLESEAGKLLIKFVGPIMLHWFASTQGEMIDGIITDGSAEKIKATCQLATQAVTAETIEPLIMFLVPLLKGLATGGLDALVKDDPVPAAAARGLGAAQSDPIKDIINTEVTEKAPA